MRPRRRWLIACALGLAGPLAAAPARRVAPTVVWQPSHQTDTGVDFDEAATSNAIVEAAMATRTPTRMRELKSWSVGRPDVHHAAAGSNTDPEATTAIVDGKPSGYAWEVQRANRAHADVFVAVHINGGTGRHAVWGYVHHGDRYEAENRGLAARLVRAITEATGMEDRGVVLDATTPRRAYVCRASGQPGFYSLDENVNAAPYRVLLEIGDNAASRAFLADPANLKKIGEAAKRALADWWRERTP